MQEVRLEKCLHGMAKAYCGICNRPIGKPITSRESGINTPKSGADDLRFIIVYYKDIDKLYNFPKDATHVHLSFNSISMLVLQKLLSYFSTLKVLNCVHSAQRYSNFDKLSRVASERGFQLTFDYVRAKGGRAKISEGRDNSSLQKTRALVIKAIKENKERWDELNILGLDWLEQFKRYFSIDCSHTTNISQRDMADALGYKAGYMHGIIMAIINYLNPEVPLNMQVMKYRKTLLNKIAEAKKQSNSD